MRQEQASHQVRNCFHLLLQGRALWKARGQVVIRSPTKIQVACRHDGRFVEGNPIADFLTKALCNFCHVTREDFWKVERNQAAAFFDMQRPRKMNDTDNWLHLCRPDSSNEFVVVIKGVLVVLSWPRFQP